MASGADMSARMTSLAFNIALMGFLLIEGVMSALRGGLDGATQGLRPFAEKIASGDLLAVEGHAALLSGVERPQEFVQSALANGFAWVMAYGAASALLLAVASLLVFAPGRKVARRVPATCQTCGGKV